MSHGTFTVSMSNNERSNLLHDCTVVEFSIPKKNLDSVKATGIDESSIKNWRARAHFLSQPLLVMLNNSFSRGVFPDCLKIATILPKNKHG